MKKFLLLSFTFILGQVLMAQVLQNTKWKVFNPSLFDTLTVEIGVDTVHQYIEPDSILVSSLYWEDNYTIKIVDVAGDLGCTNPDTGYYEFSIISDSLYILLLSDDCIPRGIAYDGVVLWRVDIPSTIDDGDMVKRYDLKLFPNPATLGSNVHMRSQFDGNLEIFNSVGQKVKQVINYRANSTETFSLEKGIYIVKLSTPKTSYSSKLLIE